MTDQLIQSPSLATSATPLCPVFGECGGCKYQDKTYEAELAIKDRELRALFDRKLGLDASIFEPITASPKPYHYRNRLDLSLIKTKAGEVFVGFMPENRFHVLEVDECPIADEAISDFIPQLKIEAEDRLPQDYRIASLVVKTGDDGAIQWGGIGRRSLRMAEKDYFWTEIDGKRVFYSLETFFQANNSILSLVRDKIRNWLKPETAETFLDLYSGVGLFGILFAEDYKNIVMMEDNKFSTKVADYNVKFHGYKNIQVVTDRIENQTQFFNLLEKSGSPSVAIVDPPRKGLSKTSQEIIQNMKFLSSLVYLSCKPDSLVRDLKAFREAGWSIEKVAPFDFFPKTKHIETLVLLKPRQEGGSYVG